MNLFLETNISFKIHLLCCFYLTGLIWTIQSVHYPAYHYIDLAKFTSYQEFHTKWITPVVAPFMILELLTACLLVYSKKNQTFWIFNLVALILIWVVTFALSVPSHNALMKSYNYKAAQFLIVTNWLRTCLWSIRSIALFHLWTKL